MKKNKSVLSKKNQSKTPSQEVFKSGYDLIDKSFEKIPIYRGGKKTGSFLGVLIDNFIDFILPKK